ncbi:MAG: ABC-2 family transporter protein [Lachnospiraceae bacterium]|nr:ABC-2 family transporter protein [Lachnospiraceae bacterium]
MKLYGKFFMIHLKSIMEYKTSFILSCIGQFLVSFNVFLGMYFMFRRFSNVEGFTYNDVLLCFGITLMEFSLAESFARRFDTFPSVIRNGEFDRIMVRPRNEILQVLGSRVEFSRIGRILQALVMFTYGFAVSGIRWTFGKIVTIIFMLIGGTAVFSGLFLIYAAICFFTLEGLEFMNIFTDGAREYGKYPVSIYGKTVFQLCTFVVPYALIQYYPLLVLLDRGKPYYSLLPLAACLFLIPCLLLWKTGVRHYSSAGS